MELTKQNIEKVFKELYGKKARLLDFFVNDMRITYGYDNGKKNSEIKQENFGFWSNMGESESCRATDENILKLRDIFGLSAYSFGHNCCHLTYVRASER